MAQHDFVISNGSGRAVREDIDAALKALVSNNSGNGDPSLITSYAYQFWADTNAGLLKMRNGANNAWITLRKLDGTLSIEAGTVSAPGLYFTGDPNTGIYSPAADQLAITTGGVERLRFDGGVRITTNAPSATIGNVYLVPVSAGQARFHLYNGGAQAEWLFGQKSSTDHSFKISKSIGGVETDYFVIDSDGALRVPNLNGGPLAGFRNLLINANPIINQRSYVSGTATSGANQYTLDRWRVVTSGQNISWTDTANVRTVTAPAGGVEQVIEGLNILTGTYALNWTGTATATVAGNAVVKGGTVTLTGGTNTTIRFSGGTFSLPQLEPGTVATPFERRPRGVELALCQRYFQFFGAGATGQEETATTFSIAGRLPQTMRATPTAEFIGSAFSTRITGVDRTLTGVSITSSSITSEAVWFLLTNSDGGNTAGRIFQNRDAIPAIRLSAEL